MRVRTGLTTMLAIVVLMLILPDVKPADAQSSRTVFWNRWDVNIDNVDTSNNHFDVTELYDVQFTGTFRFGSRVVEMTNLTGITNVTVEQNGQPLQSGCNQTAGTYCVSRGSSGMTIAYYFFQPITNGSAKFALHYTVDGALRSYAGGDQLWWAAIPSNHFGFGIGASTITLKLPDGFAPRTGTDPVVTYGAPANVDVNGTTVTATATRQIGGDENFEIRAQYPHDPNLAAPAWQGSFDQQRNFQDNVQPIINIVVFLIALVIALGGPLAIYMLYMTKGRDPKVGVVPEYLSEPPSNLSPAVVGTLIDERADVRDVMSIMIDLARRGYIVIEEEQTEGLFGLGKSSTFTFKRTDKSDSDLKPYEARFMNNVFSGGKMERTLTSLQNKFYSVIPQIQNDLYDALITEGLFPEKPTSVRNRWSFIGVLLLGLAAAAFFFGVGGLADTYGDILVCIPFAVGLVGIVALITAQAMPAKTQKGAEEAAKWNAFLEYLRHLDKYGDVGSAAQHFDEYLPYAVAFNLDHTWMQRFRSVPNMQVPYWYYPTYLGGPYRRGYVPGTPISAGSPFGGGASFTGAGDLAHAPGGGVSLDNMSNNLSNGLENLSTGLSTMLDSASRALTSRPQSSSSGSSGHWSGGGGSFSGGGGGGGGSSGGGSSGFG